MADTSKLIPLDEDVKEEISNFLETAEFLSSSRLLYSGNLVDPPEYQDACNICNYPDGDHKEECIVGILEDLIK